MANKRTLYPIPANAWTKIVDGATAAKILQKKKGVTYNSMVYTANTDTPSGLPSANPTSEKMHFDEADSHFLSDSANVWMWVRCNPDEVGELVVTL